MSETQQKMTIGKFLKVYWADLFALNGWFILFSLPLFVCIALSLFNTSLIISTSESVSNQVLVTMLILLPCLLLFSLGMCGELNGVYALYYDNGDKPTKLFWNGIKKHWISFLLFGLIAWASLFIAIMSTMLYGLMDTSWFLIGIGIFVSIAQSLFVIPLMFVAMAMSIMYPDSLKNIFSNSVKIYFMRSFELIAKTFLAYLPIVISIFLPMFLQLAMDTLYMVALVTYTVLFQIKLCKKIFDGIVGQISHDGGLE